MHRLRRFRDRLRDDVAYVLPMCVFLALTQIGVVWPRLYPATYVAKTLIVASLLILLWPRFTRPRWDYWWLGALLGVVGVVQWIAMQNWIWRHAMFSFLARPQDPFNPLTAFSSAWQTWGFIAIRLAGATLLVPVMEELFWRDFAWRQIIAPNDFKLAGVGEWDWRPFLIVPLIFAAVHLNWLFTAIVWAFMIGGLLAVTRSLGACIVMHFVTNLLLGLYVLWKKDWAFW
jgi:CAAX prenyl protease-like protein